MQYVAEYFDDEEQAVLRSYFTNLDGPVFAGQPPEVKGALFARYSRPTRVFVACSSTSSSAISTSAATSPWTQSIGLRRGAAYDRCS
jgi:hypothetical protein